MEIGNEERVQEILKSHEGWTAAAISYIMFLCLSH